MPKIFQQVPEPEPGPDNITETKLVDALTFTMISDNLLYSYITRF